MPALDNSFQAWADVPGVAQRQAAMVLREINAQKEAHLRGLIKIAKFHGYTEVDFPSWKFSYDTEQRYPNSFRITVTARPVPPYIRVKIADLEKKLAEMEATHAKA